MSQSQQRRDGGFCVSPSGCTQPPILPSPTGHCVQDSTFVLFSTALLCLPLLGFHYFSCLLFLRHISPLFLIEIRSSPQFIHPHTSPLFVTLCCPSGPLCATRHSALRTHPLHLTPPPPPPHTHTHPPTHRLLLLVRTVCMLRTTLDCSAPLLPLAAPAPPATVDPSAASSVVEEDKHPHVSVGVKAAHALQAPEGQLALLARSPQAASTFSLRLGMQGMQTGWRSAG